MWATGDPFDAVHRLDCHERLAERNRQQLATQGRSGRRSSPSFVVVACQALGGALRQAGSRAQGRRRTGDTAPAGAALVPGTPN